MGHSERSDELSRAALQLVVQANDLQHEANRLVAEGQYLDAAGFCYRVGAKLELAALRQKEAEREMRRGEADDSSGQAPLPASVSATPEGSQRGRNGV